MCMKKQEQDIAAAIREALKGKKVPILVLDNRWHTLFPRGEKPADIEKLENKLNDLLKQQGHLVNEIKDLKKTKKKLIEGIVYGMGGETDFDNRKKDKQQQFMAELKERIERESDELMEIPYQIQAVNEELLVLGAGYCFERLENGDEMIQMLTDDINEMRRELKEKVGDKAELEESMDSAYAIMHGILGHDVMNIYDKMHKRLSSRRSRRFSGPAVSETSSGQTPSKKDG